MCECLEYEDGEMHLCVVCADEFKLLRAENERLRNAIELERQLAAVERRALRADEKAEGMQAAFNATLASERAAREKAERERDEWKANAILHGGNFEREALAHNATRTSLSRAVEALGKLTAMACSRYRYGYECDCATCRITRPALAEVGK